MPAPRLPTAIKIATGNRGKRPLNLREPIPKGNLDEPPEWMTDDEKEAFRYAIEHAPVGLVKKIDRGIFVAYICAESAHRRAAIEVGRAALLVKSPVQGLPVQNYYLPIMNKQAIIMRMLANELGFTPASRSRITGPEQPAELIDEDPLDRFFAS